MNAFNRLSQVFKGAEKIPFDDSSRIIIMSDVHRGDGSLADNFYRNQNLYFAALTYYYDENFTYIELGDGDELWENPRLSVIMEKHGNVFWLLSRFIRKGRFYSLFGNHDIVKRSKEYIKREDSDKLDSEVREFLSLFGSVKYHEGLILKHREWGGEVFLVHGHQVDFFNDRLWPLSRFLVRYLWRPLQLIGIQEPTSASRNRGKKVVVERQLLQWVRAKKQVLIAGHTHRPRFPKAGKSPCFNDGSCVHPRCITGIEITGGNIALIKWSVKTKTDGVLYIGRDILAGPEPLKAYIQPKEAPMGAKG